MKAYTSAFYDRVAIRVAGEQPRWLVIVYPNYPINPVDIWYTSTERIELGSFIFLPSLKSIDSITMRVDQESFFATPNTCRITWLRNGITERMINGHWAKGSKIEIYLWFKSLTSASDRLSMGTFLVDSVDEVTETTISVNCTSDEMRLIKEQPEKQLNITDYPEVPNELKGTRWPLFLGKLYDQGADRSYIMHNSGNASPAYCIDGYEFKYLAYRHPNFDANVVSAANALQYLPSLKQFAEIVNFSVSHNVVDNEWYIDIAQPDPVHLGQARYARIMPKKINPATNCGNPEYAIDLDRNTYAELYSPTHILYVHSDILLNKGLDAFKPIWDPGYHYIVRAAFNLHNVFGGSGVAVTVNSVALGTYNSEGYNETSIAIQSNAADLSELNIYIYLAADTSYAEIDGLHWKVEFWSDMGIEFETTRVRIPRNNIDVFLGRGFRHEVIKKNEHLLQNEVYVLVKGSTDVPSGTFWAYSHPVAIIWQLLRYVASYPESEIDVSNFDSAHDSMPSGISFGRFIDDPRTTKELLQVILRESNLRLFRGADNKFKLFLWNTAKGTVDMVFDNTGAKIMKDFTYQLTDVAYNWFDLEYRWSYAKGEFQEKFQKTPNGELEGGSGDPYLNHCWDQLKEAKSEWSWPQLEWVQDANIAEWAYNHLAKAWWKPAIMIRFRTSLIGHLLEPGDMIRTNHPSQNWVQNDKDFIILSVSGRGEEVEIEAIEIIDWGYT